VRGVRGAAAHGNGRDVISRAPALFWGSDLVLALQGLGSPLLDGAFLAITQLGREEFFLLLVPLVYWCVDRRFGIRLAFLFLASALATVWLKALFDAPRPYQVDARVRLIGPPETNAGFPSGHAQLTTTVWGALAWRARRRWVWSLATAVVALVALSRVHLGVHYPHDVAGGVVLGAMAVAMFARVEPALSRWLGSLSLGAQIALSIAVPGALVLVLVNRDSVAATAVLAGLASGYAIERRLGGFAAGGPSGQRALRYLLGTLGLVALFLGLRIVFGAVAPDEETAPWYALRFLRYGLVGLWTGGLWPLLALRVGLSTREPRST
jgi:membrane-associated phospholipid phosphatase